MKPSWPALAITFTLTLSGCSGTAPTTAPAAPALPTSAAAMVQEAAMADDVRQAELALALTEQAKAQGTPLVDGDTLIYLYQGTAGEEVTASGINEVPLKRVGNTGLYAGTEQVVNVDEAIISYMLTVNGRPLLDPWTHHPPMDEGSPVAVFRGVNAPQPPELKAAAGPANSKVTETQFASRTLNESRRVWVYLPPGMTPGKSYPVLLLADGQFYFDGSVHLQRMLDHLIDDGAIPPVVAIGVESNPAARYDEFVAGQPRFDAYQQFVFTEVLPWAQKEYQVATAPGGLVPVGFSNGGAWAFYTSVQFPDLVQKAILQSPVVSQTTLPGAPAGTRYYMTVGTLDQLGLQCANAIRTALTASGNPLQVAQGVGGHDLALAETQLVEGLRWIFKQ